MAGQSGSGRSTTRTSASTSSRSSTARPTASLYSRGFSSIYGEWETTGEAKTARRGPSRSRCASRAASAPVQVVVKKRDAANAFREVWSTLVDPADSSSTARAAVAGAADRAAEERRPGDQGRSADPRRRLHRGRARRSSRRTRGGWWTCCSRTSPFKERTSDFNVWGLCPPAAESGISRPSTGHAPALAGRRQLRRVRLRALRAHVRQPRVARRRRRSRRTSSSRSSSTARRTAAAASSTSTRRSRRTALWAPYVFVHEFGHHFAGLADEYYTSDVAYVPAADRASSRGSRTSRRCSIRRNVEVEGPGRPPARRCRRRGRRRRTRRTRSDIQARRRAIRAANKPEAEMEALFREQKAEETQLLGRTTVRRKVGAFEGAIYEAKRLLPAAGRLHHVHARRGAVLPGVPAGHRARD